MQPTHHYQRILHAKKLIDLHYDEALDLRQMAAQAHFSPFHFHRLFHRIYNHTPHRYLVRKRLDKAMELLAGRQLSIAEVCRLVGFESAASFSLLFKKRTGLTPQAWRQQQWQQQEAARRQPRQFIPHCFIESFRMDQ